MTQDEIVLLVHCAEEEQEGCLEKAKDARLRVINLKKPLNSSTPQACATHDWSRRLDYQIRGSDSKNNLCSPLGQGQKWAVKQRTEDASI